MVAVLATGCANGVFYDLSVKHRDPDCTFHYGRTVPGVCLISFRRPAFVSNVGTDAESANCEQFYVISRNLNYNPLDPWSITSETAGKNKWSTPAVLVNLFSPPPSVSNLAVTEATLSSIKLEFGAAQNAIAYQTSYAPIAVDGSLGDSVIATTGVATLDVTITGLTIHQLYRFRVQATNKHAS